MLRAATEDNRGEQQAEENGGVGESKRKMSNTHEEVTKVKW